MAKTLKAGNGSDQSGKATSNEGANKQHNAVARDEAIRRAMEQLYQKDKEIERLIEEHIADLRKDKRDIKAKMAKDHEISATMLNARYMPYKVERKARDNGDDVLADAVKEMWDACPPGSHVDLVALANKATDQSAATH